MVAIGLIVRLMRVNVAMYKQAGRGLYVHRRVHLNACNVH